MVVGAFRAFDFRIFGEEGWREAGSWGKKRVNVPYGRVGRRRALQNVLISGFRKVHPSKKRGFLLVLYTYLFVIINNFPTVQYKSV